ncbi:MAG: hypothetical protein A2340_10030 [Lentisphaerae bacterium RIFOXYB12_FULL_60_10]|nr:MAG: hypothetical protein A2340_10030 [Lentisphaerae bacterium RIFOXYB12_FULL_60_10]
MYPVVTADISDLFFLVIAVVAIIAQIRKAVRQAQNTTPGGTEPSDTDEFATETDAQEQLRRFLNSLNGTSLPKPAPPRPQQRLAPPPIPKSRTVAQTPIRTPAAAYRRQTMPSPRPVKTQRQPTGTGHVSAPVAGVARVATVARVARVAQTASHDAYQVIRRHAANRQPTTVLTGPQRKKQLKQAILMREVLGPPLAFRQPANPSNPAY